MLGGGVPRPDGDQVVKVEGKLRALGLAAGAAPSRWRPDRTVYLRAVEEECDEGFSSISALRPKVLTLIELKLRVLKVGGLVARPQQVHEHGANGLDGAKRSHSRRGLCGADREGAPGASCYEPDLPAEAPSVSQRHSRVRRSRAPPRSRTYGTRKPDTSRRFSRYRRPPVPTWVMDPRQGTPCCWAPPSFSQTFTTNECV